MFFVCLVLGNGCLIVLLVCTLVRKAILYVMFLLLWLLPRRHQLLRQAGGFWRGEGGLFYFILFLNKKSPFLNFFFLNLREGVVLVGVGLCHGFVSAYVGEKRNFIRDVSPSSSASSAETPNFYGKQVGFGGGRGGGCGFVLRNGCPTVLLVRTLVRK